MSSVRCLIIGPGAKTDPMPRLGRNFLPSRAGWVGRPFSVLDPVRERHLDSARLPEDSAIPRTETPSASARSFLDASLGPLAIALGIAAQIAVLRQPLGSAGTKLYAAAIG